MNILIKLMSIVSLVIAPTLAGIYSSPKDEHDAQFEKKPVIQPIKAISNWQLATVNWQLAKRTTGLATTD